MSKSKSRKKYILRMPGLRAEMRITSKGQMFVTWSRKITEDDWPTLDPVYHAWRNEAVQDWANDHGKKVLLLDTHKGVLSNPVKIEPQKEVA